MTGRLPSRTGAYDNAAEQPAAIPTFAHGLRALGYRTCLSGKMHFVGPDQLHGFEERLTTDIYPADFGWTPDWDAPEERIDWWYHNMESVRQAGVAEATNQLDFDDETAFHAVRFLRDAARTSDRRPFMLTVSFTHPHDPYVARPEHWGRYEGVAIDPPRVPLRARGVARRAQPPAAAGGGDGGGRGLGGGRRAGAAGLLRLDLLRGRPGGRDPGASWTGSAWPRTRWCC